MSGVPRRRRWTALALLAAAALASLPSAPVRGAAGEDEDIGTEWNQWGGNAARTFAVDLEPVRSAPRVLWTAKAEGDTVAEPVASGGVLFVASTKDRKVYLQAFSVSDGKPRGRQFLGDSGLFPVLAAAQGVVLLADTSGLRCFRHLGNDFAKGWVLKAGWSLAPAVDEGQVFYTNAGKVEAVDLVTGRELAVPALQTEAPPVLCRAGGPRVLAGISEGARSGYAGEFAFLTTAECPGFRVWRTAVGPLAGGLPRGWLQRMACDGNALSGWFFGTGSPCFRGKERSFPSVVQPDGNKDCAGGLCTIGGKPTIYRGMAFGFGGDGKLVTIAANGKYRVVVKEEDLPKGAGPGPATRAREAAYFGNWAADLSTGRVLWCLPALDSSRALYPVAHRTLVRVGDGGTIACYTDRPAAVAPESPAAAAAAALSKPGSGPGADPATVPPPPSGRDGLLLVDGREVEGAVEALEGGDLRVTPAGGAPPLVAPAATVLLAQAGGKVLHRGREAAILARWRSHLHPAVLRTLEEIHALLAKEDLLRDCASILEEARRWGLPEERAAVLDRSVHGHRENPFADRREAAVAPILSQKRSALKGAFLAGSDWFRDRGLRTAAACLLRDAALLGPLDPEVERKAAALVPPEFPWAQRNDAGMLWLVWAPEIVDADAAFVPPEDPVRASIRRGPWSASRDSVVLRTPHVVFRTRCLDPAIVGRCVRNAEWTVRCLTELLGAAAVRPVRGDADRMDVRLHATPEDYHAERGLAGYPMPWSAGYFSPIEGVSRFYVPGAGTADPLGRGLFQVMAHELTHHFIERRWTGGRDAVPRTPEEALEILNAPGYWCVEGVARFVEDQVVEMDRRGLRFDDPTVSSVDIAAQAEAKGALLPSSALLDGCKIDFHTLTEKEVLRVTLRNTLATCSLSGLSLFYEQSGATVYYLVNERGPEGRRAFFEYLCAYYSGIERRPAWKFLGFESAEDFDARFREFLRRLR